MMHRHKFYLSCFTTDPVLTDPLNSEMELYRRSVRPWRGRTVLRSIPYADGAFGAKNDALDRQRETHEMRHATCTT
jgi:hypothetical protein